MEGEKVFVVYGVTPDSTESTNSSEGSPSPVAPNAPKFGTLVPNRIFVGGISASTTEAELSGLFSQYGNVKATKIISDRAGVSKGYGFITFETEEEAKRIQKEADNIVLKDRKLNIAPAIKKQPFTRVYADPSQSTQNGTVMYSNGVPYMYVYHNGMAVFSAASNDGVYQVPQTQAAYSPIIYPPTIYIPQQYTYQATGPGLPSPPYVYVTAAGPTALSTHPTVSSSSHNGQHSTSGSTTTTTSSSGLATICSPSAVSSAGEAYPYPPPGMHQYAFAAPAYFHPTLPAATLEYTEPDMMTEVKPTNGRYKGSPNPYSSSSSSAQSSPSRRYNTSRCMHFGPTALLPTPNGSGDPSRTIRQIQSQQPHLVAKQVNGVTVMAYSSPLVMSSVPTPPSTPHQREGGNHFEDSGSMTPPPTPVTPGGTPNVENLFKN